VGEVAHIHFTHLILLDLTMHRGTALSHDDQLKYKQCGWVYVLRYWDDGKADERKMEEIKKIQAWEVEGLYILR
jgi:hypothetical protein